MPSRAFHVWESSRQKRLDELELVHAAFSGGTPGRKWFTTQLDRSYVVVLASEFQGFCRDLHSEAAALIAMTAPESARSVIESNLTFRRFVDRGNATPGNIGSDFGRLGFDFWPAVDAFDVRNVRRRERLEQIMIWRNAIAHSSPIPAGSLARVAETKPTFTWGKKWRRSLIGLAPHIDRALADSLSPILGSKPW